jgi:hypothetical protein
VTPAEEWGSKQPNWIVSWERSSHHAEECNLDFTTPPKRPDPKGLAERILKILDAADAK